MAYIPWYNRTGPITVGERFGLNEIPTRAKTLSPIKSYAEKPTYNWEEGDWRDQNDDSVGNTKILEDFVITEEMRRRPNAAGGRIDMKPGGLVEPGVEYYGGKYEDTTIAKKTKAAMEIGKVYDKKTKRIRKRKPTQPLGVSNNPEGRPDIKIKDWTSEQKANLKTWMKNTGSTLEDYHKQISWNKKILNMVSLQV